MYDYYAILGVPRFFSTQEEIKTAWKEQVKFFHPDAGNVAPEIALQRTQLLNEAYFMLSDINRKRSYDEKFYIAIQKAQEQQETPREKSAVLQKETPKKEAKSDDSEKKVQLFLWLAIGLVIIVIVILALDDGGGYEYDYSAPPSSSEQEIDPDAGLTKYEKPESGTIIHWTDDYDNAVTAPLEIKTSSMSNTDYFVKVCRAGSKDDYMAFYVRGGTNVECEVPLGTYIIKYACGETWYGQYDLFGSKTSYAKADETFRFYEDDGYVNGWTIELYSQINGNLQTVTIDPSEF